MLIALDEDGQVFNVLENPCATRSIFCPGCGGLVRYKSGKVLRSHFARHPAGLPLFFKNESTQHLPQVLSVQVVSQCRTS